MQLTPEQTQELKTILTNCLVRLYTEDISLLQRRGLERSITFRLALYLNEATRNVQWINQINETLRNQNELNELIKIDVEYNKNGLIPKRTPRRLNGAHPDIIIHRRRHNDLNILVIEIKGWWDDRNRDDDRIKLEDFTHQEGEYMYGLGVLIELHANNFATPEYFQTY